MKKLDENECLNLWIATVRRDKSSQYTYNQRQGHIDSLMVLLTENGVDQDSAMMLKRKVVETLVSVEGMRGKGKHNGWKENTENDFNDAIQLTYVQPNVRVEFRKIKTAQGYDQTIVNWAKEKFGDHLGQDMINAAHQPLHTLWNMFMLDVFPEEFKKGVK